MKFHLTLILLVITAHSFSQVRYLKGYIVTQSNDTIYCQVGMPPLFGKTVTIKRFPDSAEQVIPVESIKYLFNGFSKYENITFRQFEGEIHKLMRLVAEGKLNLYADQKPVGSLIKKTYAIRKADETMLINENNFNQVMPWLIADNKYLTDEFKNEKYSYNDLETLISEYNNKPVQNNSFEHNLQLNNVLSRLMTNTVSIKVIQNDCNGRVYNKLDTIPSLIDGENSLADSIVTYIKHRKKNIRGEATYTFIVTKNGKLCGIEKISGKMSAENVFIDALSVYSDLWLPGVTNSFPVCALVRLNAAFDNGKLSLQIKPF